MFLNFCSYSAFALISLLILVFEQKNYAQHDTLTCTSWVFLCMETAECKWILRTGATTCTTSLCCRKEHNLVNLNKQTDERKNNCTLALRITHSSVQSMAEYSNENSIDPSNGAASHIYHIQLPQQQQPLKHCQQHVFLFFFFFLFFLSGNAVL